MLINLMVPPAHCPMRKEPLKSLQVMSVDIKDTV